MTDDYTADEEALDALTFGDDTAASWDAPESSSSASDLFLLSTNLRGAAGVGPSSGGFASGLQGSSSGLDSLHADLFRGYSLQSLGRPAPSAAPVQAPSAASRSDDLDSLLARLESSKRAEALHSGAGTLADLDESDFDTSAMLAKMVDDFGDDEDEVAAAASAASAWGPVPAGYAFDSYAQAGSAAGPVSTPTKTHIPAPGSSPAQMPVPHPTPMQAQGTPAKGAMSLADLEARLKGASVSGPPGFGTPQQQPQQQQQQQQQPQTPTQGITYMGPALPHFQHGAPAPQGLSVDDHERQHFYIPLGSTRNLGFMTKSEIALVFRIQLSQLQSIGDPLSDDFYYQVMQARKGGKINSSGQAILPVFKSGQARNEDGSPKLPEGTLGRISAFSIHKPKRLMAIDDAGEADAAPVAAASDDQPRKTNLFAGRTLNYLVEEGYRCLMDLEDVDALLASLAPHRFEDPVRAFDRQRLVAQRAELCTRLLESLDLDELHARMKEVASGEHLVFKFFAQPKGRLLVYRSLVLLNPPSTYQLVDVLMHDMAQVAMPAVAAGSTDEKLGHLLADIVAAMPLLPYANQIFSYFLAPKHLASLIPLMRTQLLCQLLQVLLKKGHEATMMLQQNPHVPSVPGMPGIRETVHQWRAIFDHIAAGIQGRIAQLFDGLPKDAKPTLPPTTGQAAKRRGDRKGAAGAGDKKEDDKRASPAPPAAAEEKKAEPAAVPKESYALSTRFGMWELMAAFFSHANEHQRVWLNAELKEVLTAELQMLYGEYKEKKEKQAAASAAAAAEAEKAEADKAAAPAAAAADASEENKEDDSGATATSASKPSAGRRQPHVVPPAASLPPPPSPALRFLSSALLGDQSAEHASISSTWNDLHNDYMFYQHKHNAKVAQEQARQAQQAQMRAARQAQQQQQWQAYQQRGQQQRGPGASPNRPHVPPQHQHFHQHGAAPRQFQHQPQFQQQGQGQGPPPQQQGQQQPQQPQRGPMQRVQQQGGHAHQSPPAQSQGPAKPVPVWVKAGTSGAAAVKTPVKAPPASSPAPSPAK